MTEFDRLEEQYEASNDPGDRQSDEIFKELMDEFYEDIMGDFEGEN